ncbi:MAG: NAD-dependent DNA ligase LigA, partial [Saccharofermentans sp.]|nr:NAD-dependent DNA ligase LigA [Saccharofermentans sp.]
MNGQMSLFDNEDKIKEEYRGLVDKLNYHAELYYNEDNPKISDYEYDVMSSRLKQIENEHPDWIVNDSPTQRVGWKAQKGVLVKHNV